MEYNTENDRIIVKKVYPGSIAEEAGIEEGDVLLEINGSRVEDIIEYRYLINDEHLNLLIRKPDRDEWEIEVEKDFDEDLGIDFDDHFLNSPKRCSNNCIFCFIDQLPKGMRKTLYFKDDDSRLSFLQGNFVTLTNMSDKDIDRIIKYHISPINVSVHTTNPELRVRMLNNKKAGRIMETLKRLTSSGIHINCQIVACPGINDGRELERTLNDLFSMYPSISNVAVVPLGVTKYRQGLKKLDTYDKKTATDMILLMERLQKKFVEKASTPFARLADEFYIMADRRLPKYEHYGDFEQLEDGIGMIRYFENAVLESLDQVDTFKRHGSVAIITGTSATSYMRTALKEAEARLGVRINVYEVKNEFFGEKITVAGLLTAGDIIKQLKGRIAEKTALIPSSMLKAGEDIFLDDVTVSELQEALGVKIRVCSYTGEDLINTILEEVE